MKLNIFIITILATCSCSKVDTVKSYYETGELYLERTTYEEKDSIHIKFFYKNGVLESESYAHLDKGKGSKLFGVSKSYYYDGFPKDYVRCTDSGIVIMPKKEDILQKYEVKLDFDPYIDKYNDVYYLSFRLYHEVSPMHYYKVSLIDTLGEFHLPAPRTNKQKYNVGEGENAYEFVVDESLYPYAIPLNSNFLREIDKDYWEVQIGIFFTPLIGDTTIPVPHKILKDTLFIEK